MVVVMSERPVTADELPITWALTTLGTVVDYGRTEKAEPEEFDDDDWILELEDIEKSTSRLLARLTCAQRLSKSTKNRFATGDVLYGKLRPYLNKVLIADRPGYCTTEIIPLKPGGHLDGRYLFYWLKHPAFLAYVAAKSHGMNMPRLGTAAGKAAPFVLAPPAEQKRIADQLDSVLARISSCNDRLDAVSALLQRFRAAVLSAAVSGKLTAEWRSERDSEPWHTCSLGEVTASSFYGPRFGKSEYTSDPLGIPTIRTTDMDRYGRIRITSDTPRVSVSPEKLEQYRVLAGDLLITRTGSIGVMAVFEGNQLAIPSAYLIRFRFRSRLRPTFAYYRLAAPEGKRDLGLSTTAVAQPNINAEAIKRLTIALPSLAEQVEIETRVQGLFAVADRIEARLAVASTCAQELPRSLLGKAFRGELLPQDPTDEPASELLARIATERASAIASPRARRPVQRKPTRAPKESAAMTKSRQDDDVKSHPYLARHLRRLGGSASAEALFGESELPVSDFYKQLAWEIEQGLIRDGKTVLEATDAT